jgi:hypothetical protein
LVLVLLWRGVVFHTLSPSWWLAAYEPWTGYDGHWYADIAATGYTRLPQAAFFPLYPLLEHLASPLTLGHVRLAGVLISNVAGLMAFVLLRQLAAEEVSAAVARRSLLVLAFFPTSYYLVMAYTEALFLALSLGAFLALRRQRWLLASCLIALATLTRSTGILLLVPFGLEAVRALRRWLTIPSDRRDWRLMASVASGFALPLAALAGWERYLDQHFAINGALAQALDDPVWQRHLDWPWHGLVYSIGVLLHGGQPNEVFAVTRDLIFTLFWIGCAAILFGMRQRTPRGFAAYTLATLVLALAFPMHANPYDALSSIPRYVVIAFPCFIVLAQWTLTARKSLWLLAGTSLLLLACFVAIIAADGFIA